VPAPSPLFTTLLNYRYARVQQPDDQLRQQWEGITSLHTEGHTNYPLTFSVDDMGETFALTVNGIAPIDAQGLCAMTQAALRASVEALERAPLTPIGRADVLPADQREQLLIEWNATALEYPREKCLHELFEEQAARTPDAIAVVHDDRQLSYAQLNAQANRLAHHLAKDAGVTPGEHVVLLLPRSIELIVSELAISKCAAVYVPIDPEWPAERQRFMARDCQARCVLQLADVLAGLSSDHSTQNRKLATSAEASAYVMYTSGSTGEPKGVVVPHRAITRLVTCTNYIQLGPQHRIAFAANPAFDASTFEVWGALLNGASVLVVSAADALDSRGFGQLLTSHAVTTLFLTTALFNRYVREIPQALGRLQHLLYGGEACDVRLVREFLRDSAARGLIHVYGPTESTTFATWLPVNALDGHAQSVPIGRPLSNTQVYVLDGSLRAVPVGVEGELYIGGDGLALGYLNRPRQSAERFVPSPFATSSAQRLYRTGDKARWNADGTLEFLGRLDHQVKLRGFRIELGEIESALLRQGQVRDALVLMREDEPDHKQLVAYVVLHPAGELLPGEDAASELRTQLREHLPEYMIPAAFVQLESMPLTSNGKIDRKALPAPESDAYGRGEYQPPQGVTEELLASVWSAVLHVERVGREDDFFELGGHSLLATQLVSRVREVFSIELAVRMVFEHQRLRDQALAIERAQQEQSGREKPELIEAAPRSEVLRLSYAQERLWFLSELMGPSAVYTMPLALRMSGSVDERALIESLRAVVERHESLRTHFEKRDGVPEQVIESAAMMTLAVESVEGEKEVEHICRTEHSYCFKVTGERLCRIRVLRTAADAIEYVVLVTTHHSVSDGWSLGVFFREWVAMYEACAQGQPSPLEPLPIQYADYAQWQRRWLQGEVLEKQLSYWREQLTGLPALLTLPTDHPRPAEQTYRGSMEGFRVSKEVSEGLQGLSQRSGVTLFMTLLSAFAVLLSRYSGQKDLAIGTPIANRVRQETERLIGFFVNTLVMRCDLSGGPSFLELLKRSREMSLQAYAHQDVPFEHLVEALNPERSLSHSPLFQVMFALQNLPIEAMQLRGVQITPVRYAQEQGAGVSRFDLTLDMTETPLGLVGALEYNADLFERETVCRLLGHFERLLGEIVAAPDAPVMSYPLLAEQEVRQQLLGRSAAVSNALSSKRLPERLEDDIELNARANHLAHRLIEQGVGPGSLVGLQIAGGVEQLVGMLAILKAGGAYVPLDPALPQERLRYLREDCGAELVVDASMVAESEGASSSANIERRNENAALACVVYETDPQGVPIGRLGAHDSLASDPEHDLFTWPDSAAQPHYVLDDHGELLPIGVAGDLYVGGDEIGWGFLHRPGLTAERFIPNPFSQKPGDRLYRTNERARWTADGRLKRINPDDQTGRPQDVVDLERILLTHEDVLEAAVVALEAPHAQRRFAAYVVPRTSGPEAPDRLISQLKAHLRAQPRLYPVPTEWAVLDSLPRTNAGNVARSELPQPEGWRSAREYIAPRTLLEKTLAELWQDRLGLERVGVNDNYFALGGDSIRSVSLVAEAQKRGLHFQVKDLFAYPTVSSLAAAIEHGDVHLGAVTEEEQIAPFALLTDAERERLSQRHDMRAMEDAYPLSMMQQGMVLEALRHPDLSIYQNIQLYQFVDSWDAQLFAQALSHLLRRHPMLRSVHDLSGERPLQLMLKQVAPEWKVVDLQSLDDAATRLALNQWTQKEKSIPLDVSSSLWRLTVHLLSDQRFIFGMFIHHALWDGWSLESFATELYATYGTLKRQGQLAESRPLPSFRQFIALEQAAVSSERQREYWAHKLEDATVPWWTGREKAAGAIIPYEITAETSRALADLARSLGVQEKSVLCSVYLTLLWLLAGTDDVVGTAISQGRPEVPGGEKIIGVFLNALPVRMQMTGKRWVDLIEATDRELREQHEFRRYPLPEIQRVTGLDYSGAMFGYTNWHMYYEGLDQERTRDDWVPNKVGGWQDTNYLLAVLTNKDDRAQRYYLSVSADTRVFDDACRGRMREYVENTIRAIVTNATGLIDKTALLSAEELRQQLIEWNATRREYPRDKALHELFEAQVRRTPDAVAIVHNDRQLSYAELNAQANRLAHYLKKNRGVRPGDHVVLLLPRSIELVVAEIAVGKCGAAYVPVDAESTVERQQAVAADCRAPCVLQYPELAQVLADEQRHGEQDGELDSENLNLAAGGEGIACVMYGAAAAGELKGVLVPHRAITRMVMSTNYMQTEARDCLALVADAASDVRAFEVWGALLNGAAVRVVDPANVVHAPRLLVRSTPESTIFATWQAAHAITEHTPNIPLGRPVSNTQLYVLDESMHPVPVGVEGEIYIGGDGLALGYLNRAGETAKSFVPSPFATSTAERLYRTGDIGRWTSSGILERVASLEERTKRRSFSKTLRKLRQLEELLRAHENVADAVVVMPQDERSGVTAYLAPNSTASQDPGQLETALRRYIRQQPVMHWMPATFVQLDITSLTPSGRINRKTLRAPAAVASSRAAYEAPVSPLEQTLADLWAQLLGLERVGRQDNFFEIGGHSLVALRLQNELAALGHAAPIAALFKNPQLCQLAEFLSKQGSAVERRDNLVAFRTEGTDTPLFLIHQGTGDVTCLMGLARKLDGGFPIYGLELKDTGPASSIENLAAHHLATIRAIQPHGPYRLCGYSFGGLVAYEIAAQLLGEDEEVSFVGLIDTYTPDAIKRAEVHRNVATTRRRARELESDRSELPQLQVADACAAISERYYLRPICMPVQLFQAAENALGETASAGWERLPRCEIRTRSTPGDHLTMIADPCVDELAQRLSVELRQRHETAQAVRRPAFESPEIMLRSQKRSRGIVFCFPGAGASATSFMPLADAITVPLTVLGVQARGLDGRQAPHTTVEAAVTAQLQILMERDPDGPYRLLGHSYGGWLAFETASRLVLMGKTVLPVLLLDSEPPSERRERRPKHDQPEALAWYLHLVEQAKGVDLDVDAERFRSLNEREQLQALVRLMKAARAVGKSVAELSIYHSFCVFQAHLNAEYLPNTPFEQDVYLVRTCDSNDDDPQALSAEDAVKRWKTCAPNLKPIFTGGNHMTLLQRPYVDAAAELINTLW
jgi:amino acid adenylation domain-containing protein